MSEETRATTLRAVFAGSYPLIDPAIIEWHKRREQEKANRQPAQVPLHDYERRPGRGRAAKRRSSGAITAKNGTRIFSNSFAVFFPLGWARGYCRA
ncbi:MAG: hypothetical protein HC853_17255 [Anaerolineae bacterium]|nr:hypothetical protein [Anaerolineae bacterium]